MNSRGRDDAVGHIRHRVAWNVPHGSYNVTRKGAFFENVIGLTKRGYEIVERRGREPTLLDKINDFGEADWGEGNLLSCSSCRFKKASRGCR